MSKKRQNKSFNFSKKKIDNSIDFSIIHFGGNHWDDIFYFPKNYQIGLIKEGKGVFTVGQQQFEVEKGDTFFIKPQLLHKGKPHAETGWEVAQLNFNSSLIDNLIEEGAVFSIFNQLKPAISVTEKVDKLLSHFEKDMTLDEAVHLVYDFLLDCSDTPTVSPKTEGQHLAVARARIFIDNNYKNKFSLDDLAHEAFLSKFHLLRLFKQEVGLAPYTYQLQLKLNEARKLIFQKKSLTEVAYELGFNDQAHFIHTYKKYTELTPGDFLRTAIFYNSKD